MAFFLAKIMARQQKQIGVWQRTDTVGESMKEKSVIPKS